MSKHMVEIRRDGLPSYTKLLKLEAEPVGNFDPVFCRIGGKKYLVQSELGDLSDPFRRTEDYLTKLFVHIK